VCVCKSAVRVLGFHPFSLLNTKIRRSPAYSRKKGYFTHSLNLFLSIRYGKRTTQGILNDLRNALGRYYLNNFVDGTKQVNSIILLSVPQMSHFHNLA
jgi:hypothetical protein